MTIVLALLVAGAAWFGWRYWRRLPADPRLTLHYWRNSAIVLALYLLFILLGGGLTRIVLGPDRSALGSVLLGLFFALWVAYGALWLIRFLPTTRARPAWIVRGGYWLDVAAVLGLAALAIGAHLL